MNYRIGGVVAAVVVSIAGGAAARQQTPEQEVAAVTAQLIERLDLLGGAMGMEASLFPAEVLTSAFGAALPMLPAGDARNWDTSFDFDFRTDVSTGALDADAEGRTVLTDARSCLPADRVAEVVHFTRFTRGSVRGHRCVLLLESNGVWVLQSRTFAEGPDRRLTAYYAVATLVEGDPAEARRLLEERLDQNVALAATLADYALEASVNNQGGANGGGDGVADRLERLTERLVAVAASVESSGP